MTLFMACTGAAVAAWSYLLLGRSRFWRVHLPFPQSHAARDSQPVPRVVAVVPARDEAEVVGECVASLLDQRGVELRIVLVDDGSTDGTAEIARRAAGASAGRLTMVQGRPLPSGWSGKLWAVSQGVEHAVSMLNAGWCAATGSENDDRTAVGHQGSVRKNAGNKDVIFTAAAHLGTAQEINARKATRCAAIDCDVTGKRAPDFLLLTDADIRHAPNNVSRLVAIAGQQRADLASFMVKLSCRTIPERLLIPAFVFFFFMLYPPRWIAEPRKRTAAAAGGSILLCPAALERAGGIAAIRGEIIDDCALARAVKRSGGRVWLGLTDSAESLREYKTFSEIGRMIARTAFNQLDHSTALLLGSIAGLALIYILPVVALFSGNHAAAVLGAVAWLAMTAAYLPMVRFYGLNPAWALTLPAAAAFYMGATIFSAIQYLAGHGGRWKGRAQDAK
jgi:hopene-associated glycosyltransferase HpnB